MSNPSGLLQAYMADDPNLITQPTPTENGASGPLHDGPPIGQHNTQGTTATGPDATPGTTNAVGEGRDPDVEMSNSQGQSGQPATNLGTIFGALMPAAWFPPNLDTENRKRKNRSPSLVAATDGGDQPPDTIGAHKKRRATPSAVDNPEQEAENGAADGQDSTTRPSGSEGGAPEQNPDPQSMPGALSLRTGGSASSQPPGHAEPSPETSTGGETGNGPSMSGTATATSTTEGVPTPVASGLPPATIDNASIPSPQHTNPTSGEVTASAGQGTATTSTPLSSPPPTSDRPTPSTSETPRHASPPPLNRPIKNLPSNGKARSGVTHGPAGGLPPGSSRPLPVPPGMTPTNPTPPSSSTAPNNPNPWSALAQQFDGVRAEIHTMGTHMRTMNNNIGRLDNAMGIMSEQHTELMSVLRMGFAAAGQQASPSGPPPTSSQPPAAPAGQRSLMLTAPPAAGPAAPVVAVIPVPSLNHSRTTATLRHRGHASTSSHETSSTLSGPSRPQASSDDDMEIDEGDVADNEDEIPAPLPVLVKTAKLKLKGMPKTRDPMRKALLDDIALMARKYMGREADSDDEEDGDVLYFDEMKVPSRTEVDSFTGRDGQCCTIDNFRPDLLGTPKSTWNQSVAQVFAKAYVKTTTAQSKDVMKVQQAFGVHMKSLINSFKTFQASRTDNDAKRQKRRRYMRKSYAHERRMLTVASHDGLKRHLWIIQALGVQGMSSDESEHEGTKVRYRRTTLVWRNPSLEAFLQVIDVFHDASRFTNGVDRSSKSGAHVHLRLPARKNSERAAVPGLPSAAYNPAWLKNLSDFFRNRLNISNIQYGFEHPPEVMKEMMQLLQPPPPDHIKDTISPTQ